MRMCYNLSEPQNRNTCHFFFLYCSLLNIPFRAAALDFTCSRYLPVSARAALRVYVQEYFHLSTVALVVECDLETRADGKGDL